MVDSESAQQHKLCDVVIPLPGSKVEVPTWLSPLWKSDARICNVLSGKIPDNTPEHLKSCVAPKGCYRPLISTATHLKAERFLATGTSGLKISFQLQPGTFATSLIREAAAEWIPTEE